jgi:hypothetical protein
MRSHRLRANSTGHCRRRRILLLSRTTCRTSTVNPICRFLIRLDRLPGRDEKVLQGASGEVRAGDGPLALLHVR